MQPTQTGLTVHEAQQDWFNTTKFQQEEHDIAYSILGFENPDLCRIRGLHRSASLKFCQPVFVWALCEMRFKHFLKGCILADSVRLGKTWEAVTYLLRLAPSQLLFSISGVQKILPSAIIASVYVVCGTQQYMQITNEITGMARVGIPIEKKGGDRREGYAYYLYCKFSH
ncbi:hypothetical protein BDV41DRAFT_172683 [Aspergillus transmontanensis]|uniref:SNF2 N-terminal domain-containing protein n=1 Tax=Aspergillus transmontanensis TaxID=1034304 RepID=A0A5N6WH69_9EURO|nr:hypothetical protein BDV41DRAFT_172683 [Aspergillus transmontanensis]